MIYIRLFHGRTDPNKDMDDWGSDGPVFGPYEFVQTTYTWSIKLGKPDGNCDQLTSFEDMLYYGGVYYSDWSIFSIETFGKSKLKVAIFDQEKANLPKKISS